jgi:glycosyltransferase involved in cell wall biosynthesis
VSESLRQVYLKRRLASPAKTAVLGPGSANGVDLHRFGDAVATRVKAKALREQLGIPDGAPVIGYVGRLTRDKGIVELFHAFKAARKAVADLRLLLVGDFETGDPVPDDCARQIQSHPQIHLSPGGRVDDVAPYYLLMDVLAFPSYREGFGNVVLEAGAASVPVAGFRATGTVDSVQNGVTGTLVPIGDVPQLAHAIQRYFEDHRLRRAHGRAARERVERQFREEAICQRLYDEYLRLLRSRGLPVPEPATAGKTPERRVRRAA